MNGNAVKYAHVEKLQNFLWQKKSENTKNYESNSNWEACATKIEWFKNFQNIKGYQKILKQIVNRKYSQEMQKFVLKFNKIL